jgi:hypothetical protein
MDLKTQIQLLIDNAPNDGITPQLVTAIAPVISAIAQRLRHHQYYILQNLEKDWILTTLSNRANPGLEKRVIYAYPTLQDVPLSFNAGLDPQVIAALIPIADILFQLVALEPVDSIVFFETPGMSTNPVEIKRTELQHLILELLQQKHSRTVIPPDIA